MKNCCVACLSAMKNSSGSADVALVTNVEVESPYREILQSNNVKICLVPFDLFDFGNECTWSLAFYKLCALYHISRETNYGYYAYLDTDVFIQHDFENIWHECNQHILMYDINHGLQVEHYRHFLSEVELYFSSKIILTHFGGEFFAANKENAILISQKFLDICNVMRENNLTTTHGDEFIISIAAYGEQDRIKNAGAYIYRFWTGQFRLVSTSYEYNPVAVLHVPSEKESGIIRIYNYYIKNKELPSNKMVWGMLHLKHRAFIPIIKTTIKHIVHTS